MPDYTLIESNPPAAPLVSVITPVCNVERYLPQCVESLLAQKLADVELIMIDDGSTDGSLDILRDYQRRDPRIRVVTKPNAGYGATMNLGLSLARGAYVGIVESDDYAEPGMFSTLCHFATANDCDLVKCGYFEHTEEGDRTQQPYGGLPLRQVFDPRDEPRVILLAPLIWAGLYRRSMIEDNGIRFNETPGASYQDTSFVFQCWASARRAALLPQPLLHYRVDNAGSSVRSTRKVFAVCDEYRLSEEFLARDEARAKAFSAMLNVAKLGTYKWNFDRIDDSCRPEFAARMAQEFAAAARAGTLDRALFSEDDWHLVQELVGQPGGFAERHAAGLFAPSAPAAPASEKEDVPLVSVVVPFKDDGQTIRRCLDCLVWQTMRSLEVVCVDGGSHDSSAHIASIYAQRDPRVRVVRLASTSYVALLRRGASLARGAYVSFVDPRDTVAADLLERLCQAAGEGEVGVVAADRTRHVYDEGAEEDVRVARFGDGRAYGGPFVPAGEPGAVLADDSLAACLFRRELVQDEAAFADASASWRASFWSCVLARAGRVAGLADASLYQERHDARAGLSGPSRNGSGLWAMRCRSTVALCLNGLSEDEAVACIGATARALSRDDELVVVSPCARALVERAGEAFSAPCRILPDGPVVRQGCVGLLDLPLVHGETLVVLAPQDATACAGLLAEDSPHAAFEARGASFACRVPREVVGRWPEEERSLPLVALRCAGRAGASGELPDDWTSRLVSHLHRDDAYAQALDAASALFRQLGSAKVGYAEKRRLYGSLLGLWTDVRRDYLGLWWGFEECARGSFVAMGDVPSVDYPHEDAPKAPSLSVIVPVYNASAYLEKCLESIALQDYVDYEVVAVNDGSTDDSLAILERHADDDPRIRVVSQPNCGAGVARNRGIALARGRRLAFIDPDDLYPNTHALGALVEAMERTGALVCGGSLSLLQPDGSVVSDFDFYEAYYHVAREADVDAHDCWTDYGWIRFMYDASLFADGTVRFPPYACYEDPVFFVRALLRAGSCHVIPHETYRYRVNYKTPTWTPARTCDLLRGIGDNLQAARENQMPALYAELVGRFADAVYRDAVADNLHDDGVLALLVAMQDSIDEDLLREAYSDGLAFHRLPVWDRALEGPAGKGSESGRRRVAIERAATRIARSQPYVGMQHLVERLRGMRRSG